MKYPIYLFVLTLFYVNSHSQTIWDLYEEKDRFHCDTCQSEESRVFVSYKVLEQNINNKYAQNNILIHYSRENKFDLAQAFIDSLITQEDLEPKSIINLAFLLFNNKPSQNPEKNELYLKLLQKGLEYKETKGLASFLLSQYYYLDFITPLKKDPPTKIQWVSENDEKWEEEDNKRTAEDLNITLDSLMKLYESLEYKTVYPNAVDSAIKYLEILTNTNHLYNNLAKIPLNQLKSYNGLESYFEIDSNLSNNYYFPEWYFGYLPNDWRTNYSLDLFEEMFEHSYNSVQWLSRSLKEFDEPILYKNTSELSYRIFFNPTFHNPIIIRLYQEKNKNVLVWKVIKGKGGYETDGILKSGKEYISKAYFNQLTSQLDSAELSLEETYHFMLLNDGAITLIERNHGSNYKAYQALFISETTGNVFKEIAKKHFPEIEFGGYGF